MTENIRDIVLKKIELNEMLNTEEAVEWFKIKQEHRVIPTTIGPTLMEQFFEERKKPK